MTDKQTKQAKIKKPRNYFKLIFKGLLYFILGIIALNVLVYLLLCIPYVQTAVVNYGIKKIEPIVKTKVSIDNVQLKLFYHVHIGGFYVESQEKDTLLYAKDLDAQFDLWGLLKKELRIKNVALDGLVANVSQKTPTSDFNFQFLIDAFASDSTAAPATNPMTVAIDNISVKNGRLNYNVLSEAETPTFNVSHIALSDLNIGLALGVIDPKNLDASISQLSFEEKSGFKVNNLQAAVSSNDSVVSMSKLQLNLPQSALTVARVDYNTLTHQLTVNAAKGKVSPQDLSPFAASMQSLKSDFSFQANVDGCLPQLHVSNILFSYGNDLDLAGSASSSNITDLGKATYAINLDKFRISPQGITDCIRLGDSTVLMPPLLTTLGDIRINAKLNGRLAQLKLSGDLWTNLGAVNVSSDIATESTFQNLDIDARVYTENFNINPLVGQPDFKRVSLHTNIVAKQAKNSPFSVDLDGAIDALEYKQTILKNILISSHYDPQKMGGVLHAVLPVGSLLATVDIDNTTHIPAYNFDVLLSDLKIDHWYKNPNWKNPLLSFHLFGNLRAADVNTILGSATLDSLHFRGDNFDIKPAKMTLVSQVNDSVQDIEFNSSIMKGSLLGKYNFRQLSDELSNQMHAYLPSLFPANKTIKRKGNKFDLKLAIASTEKLSQIFNLPVVLTKPAQIEGVIDMVDNKIHLQANIPHLMYGALAVESTTVNMETSKDSTFTIDATTAFVQKAQRIGLKLKMQACADSLRTVLLANTIQSDSSSKSLSIKVDGKINTLTHFAKTADGKLTSILKLYPTDIALSDLKMRLLPATISNEDGKTKVSNLGITLDKEPYLVMNGIVSSDPTDSLIFSFNKSQLGDLLKPFNIDHVEAVADGNITIKNSLDSPKIFTRDLGLNNIVLFNDTLGTLKLESDWNNDLRAVKLNAKLTNRETSSTVTGLIYPSADSLDVGVKLDRLSLNWLQPFASDLVNKLTGSLSSNISIKGKLSSPSFEGWIGANQLSLGVDYTNVTYTVSDTINVARNKIGFNNLIVKDNFGNTAITTAEITHNNFNDLEYKLNLKLNNLMVLNTMSRTDSLFYGKIFASGDVVLNGDKDGVDVKMKIKNEKNSVLNILIPQTSEASDYRSIVYINTPKKDSIVVSAPVAPRKIFPLKLGVDLDINPDIALNVVINPITGDAMQIKGAGLINYDYDMESGNMKAFGDYTLSEGSVKLKLQHLSTEFKIEAGSKIHFVGDPLRSTFEMSAYHRVKSVDLTTLDPSFALDGMSSTKTTVDCVLGIKGDMQKIELTYDIRLPDAGDDVQQKVKSLINTNEDKLRQFAYLIAAGCFYSNSSSTSLTSGLWTNVATSALSSSLNALMGNALGDKWEVGTNIDSNDGTFSNMDMSVSVSTKLLNDKLKVNTNLGYRTDQTNSSENTFIGDFDAEYQLTHSIKLKAYNKTNDKIYDQSATTQGVGIIYTKEAKSLKELFHFF